MKQHSPMDDFQKTVAWIRSLAWNPPQTRRHHNGAHYNHSRSSGERISVFWGILDNIRRALQMGETQVQGRHGRVRAPPPLPDVLSSARMVAAPSSPLRGLGGSESRHRQPSLRSCVEVAPWCPALSPHQPRRVGPE